MDSEPCLLHADQLYRYNSTSGSPNVDAPTAVMRRNIPHRASGERRSDRLRVLSLRKGLRKRHMVLPTLSDRPRHTPQRGSPPSHPNIITHSPRSTVRPHIPPCLPATTGSPVTARIAPATASARPPRTTRAKDVTGACSTAGMCAAGSNGACTTVAVLASAASAAKPGVACSAWWSSILSHTARTVGVRHGARRAEGGRTVDEHEEGRVFDRGAVVDAVRGH